MQSFGRRDMEGPVWLRPREDDVALTPWHEGYGRAEGVDEASASCAPRRCSAVVTSQVNPSVRTFYAKVSTTSEEH